MTEKLCNQKERKQRTSCVLSVEVLKFTTSLNASRRSAYRSVLCLCFVSEPQRCLVFGYFTYIQMSAHPVCLNLCLTRQAGTLHAPLKRQKMHILPHCWADAMLQAHELSLCFHHHVTWGWEHEVQGQTLRTGGSPGRCAAAPCAWWRPLYVGFVVPPGTP